ncbi:universal stress protein [Waterburya agarophytonicola K14]|uniref:Universal stress protein n=1 Tax=Waterburya agarophytonicola KI4 TaxID=2874699 RepID=A0A964FGA8_9CYAN|nr:universal stress protein [Waterburya agarophytonicola]MCC0177776.1 universal stress protein [Waterburya agarophytonicola KI4]
MINKILVAVDRLENNQSIFNTAVSLAQTNNAKLMLLHGLSQTEANYPALLTYTYYPMMDDREHKTYQKQLEKYRQWELDFLQDLTEKAIAAGIDAEYTQLTGNPGHTICELAETWSADLILVGSRGLKGLKEMFLGSVSNYVTHHAPCSVLIVRQSINNESEQTSSKSAKADGELLTPDLTRN